MEFLCPECTSTWHIPPGAIGALIYNILFNSVAAYGILTWANQYATGTLVMIYTVLQPVTAAFLTTILVSVLHIYPSCFPNDDTQDDSNSTMTTTLSSSSSSTITTTTACLDLPGWETLVGMIGVFLGLMLVITTEPNTDLSHTKYEPVESLSSTETSKAKTTTAAAAAAAECLAFTSRSQARHSQFTQLELT
jgi:drug/metabolite transporter (DMT)-like permease